MKRQKRYDILEDRDEEPISMQRLTAKPENTLEAKICDGDTLQALALKFHCTVAEIKRLNKIDKDNEIFARNVIKVPITPHSVLLETLPIVHTSGQNSPKHNESTDNFTADPLRENNFNEKLLVMSVNATAITSINDVILNSRHKSNTYADDDFNHQPENGQQFRENLLSGEIDETIPHPNPIRAAPPSKGAFDWSGSDCDISWICLFICILAMCFAIPLIYVFYIAEHPERFHHNST